MTNQNDHLFIYNNKNGPDVVIEAIYPGQSLLMGSPPCSPDRRAGEEGHLIRKSRQCSKGLSIKQNELSALPLGIFLSAALMPSFL